MTELINLTIKETLKKLRNKEISTKELVSAYIKRAEETRNLNAYVLETFDHALKQAEISQDLYNKGEARALESIPIAVKDLFCTKGFRTTACSKMLQDFVPQYESTVTHKLFAQGAIMLGKTNMDEFAMGSSNSTSVFGGCENPWRSKDNPDKKLVPGGSSGGSAITVAARSAMASLGSDTGGSIRQPAAFTGIVGIKPSYGRCSRFGMVAFASSLDQAGVFAGNIEDAAIVLENMMGSDNFDSTIIKQNPPRLSDIKLESLKGKKIGIPKEYHNEMLSNETVSLWHKGAEMLKDAGAEIVEVSLPHTEFALPVYYMIAPAEASSNLSRYDGVRYGYRTSKEISNINELYEYTRAEGFGDEVKRRIIIGTYVLASEHMNSYFQKAQKVRTCVINDFKNVFTEVDAILTPTTPSYAFAMDEKIDPIHMYMNDIFTIPASLAGLPCMSLPSGLSSNGLPLGLQIITNHMDEETMVKVALALEKNINFNYKPNIA